jgi:DNA-binding PadR family transcriptional regulator
MANLLEASDYIKISALDVRVLVALLKGKMNSYEVARQVESDDSSGVRVTNNPLYSSMRSLEALGCIQQVHNSAYQPRNSKTYEITSLGRQLLNQELKRISHLLSLARKRS